MSIIAKRLEQITPSLTLNITNRAKAMREQGEEIYGLAGGEPDVDTPDFIKQAAIVALEEGKTKYTPASGILPLREAIVDKIERENNVSYEPSLVTVTAGAKSACYNAILAVCEEGDEVIVPAPYWLSYPEMIRLAGATPVIVDTKEEDGWKITPEQFENHMTGRTKMIILNTPSNPTGAVYSKEELLALGEVAASEDILILSDEIYENLIYDGEEHVSIASLSNELKNLTITVNGFSKCYSMTGWRVGYVAAPEPIAKAIQSIQSHTLSNPSSIAQYAALAALNDAAGKSFLTDLKGEYEMRRSFVVERLRQINNISFLEPKGAFYVFVNIEQMGINSVNFCDKLLSRYQVATVPGIAFGNDYALRLSYCTSLDILNEGLNSFEEFCSTH